VAGGAPLGREWAGSGAWGATDSASLAGGFVGVAGRRDNIASISCA